MSLFTNEVREEGVYTLFRTSAVNIVYLYIRRYKFLYLILLYWTATHRLFAYYFCKSYCLAGKINAC